MKNGIVNVYKESGFTSHDVVAKLRGILKQKKIGHTGTLDPEAQGVLPVCAGKATKLCDMLTDENKTYVAELLLGVETDTQDMTGSVLKESPLTCTIEKVREVIKGFVGESKQIPPMYSALKVNGKRLYELAREGIEIERKARTIKIFDICILEESLPVIKIEVTCSKGTYIRTLCHDIGQKLGCGGCMKSLLRTRVGRFCVEDSVTLSQIEQAAAKDSLQSLICPIDTMFLQLPEIFVKEAYTSLLKNGNSFQKEHCMGESVVVGRVRVYDCKEQFVGVYEWNQERQLYKPVRIFWETI